VSRVAQSVWCLATGWMRGRSKFDPQQRRKDFPIACVSRSDVGPTQPLYNGYRVSFPRTLTTHPHLVPRSRMSRSYTYSPPQSPPWCVVGQLEFLKFSYYSGIYVFILIASIVVTFMIQYYIRH
jgi:hypothetical protein